MGMCGIALLAFAPASAWGVTIGSVDLPAGGFGSICFDQCTVFQGQVSPATQPRYVLKVPADGTITGWSFRNGTVEAGNVFALRVLRPTDVSETQFAVVGTAVAPEVPDNADAVRGPFPASIAVRAGDRIGLQARGPFNFGVPLALTGQNDPTTGDGVRYFDPDLADGRSGTPADAGNTGQTVLVQAQIDETPPPPPPPPPAPDFSVALLGNVGTTFAMTPTGSVTVPLGLRRSDLSRGPIALSVSGAPAGIVASIQSPRVDVPGTVSDPLTIKAGPGGPPAPGSYRLTITGTPLSATAGTAPRSLTITLFVVGQLAVQVQGIEVTQAVQTLGQPQVSTYRGVPLITRKKVVAKVFVGLNGVEGTRTLKGTPRRPPLGVTLSGYDASGHELPFSPVLAEWSPPVDGLVLNAGSLSTDERVADDAAYTFVLPDTWSKRGPITLRARAVSSNAPLGFAGNEICSDVSCGATPTADLRGIPFMRNPDPFNLNVLGLIIYDPANGNVQSSPGPVTGVFTKLLAMTPVPYRFLLPDGSPTIYPVYRAVEYGPNNALLEATQAFDDDIGHDGNGTIGLFNNQPGAGVTVGRNSVGTIDRDAAGNVTRPTTVIAHELFHQLGLGHADSVCGGGGDGRPEANGRLYAVGTDTSGSPPYRVIADTVFNRAYDLMSYCNITLGDPRHWISELNWDRLLKVALPSRHVRQAGAAVARSAVAGGGLRVYARADAGGVRIVSVAPASGAAPSAPASSPYTLVARAANGRAISSTPLDARTATDAPAPYTALQGTAHGAGIARLEIVSGGAVVASRDRSAHAPTAAVLSPGRGATVGARGSVTVRWRASDADRDPLRVTLDFSANGGRSFRTVFAGPDTGAAKLSDMLLAATPHARFRLRANDGFGETRVLSKPFAIAARRPSVAILQPPPGARFSGGSVVFLQGAAVDDRGHPVAGRRLRWLADGETLGRGEQLTAVVPAGTRRLRLVATDPRGRTGSAAARVKVPASRPFFLRLSAPRRLSRRARSVTLVVATTQAATLRSGRHRFPVGRAARRVRVPVRPGRKPLTLRLTLTSGGLSTPQVVTIRRG